MTENKKYMLQALLSAKKRLGFTEPNPAVGALVVRRNTVIAEGFHWGAGKPHAEVEALSKLSESEKKESTLYVTLEPCCHVGRTPPCTDLIIKSGIKKVVYGFSDPNPLVQGKGCLELRKHSIDVEECGGEELNAFYEGYAYWQKTQKPFVTLKMAVSQDGKVAGLDGKRVKLTGEETDKFTHEKRLYSSAILTTSDTVNADDPLFNCRLISPEKKKVYIVDRNIKLKEDLKIFSSASEVILLVSAKTPEEKKQQWLKRGVKVIETETLLQTLGKEGNHTLWVEAGPRFSKYFLKSGLTNRFIVYHSKVIVGKGLSFSLESEALLPLELSREFSLGEEKVKVWDLPSNPLTH